MCCSAGATPVRRARCVCAHSLAETGVTPRHSLDLLIAFRRDATKLRYADWDELYDYCRYSAMPVGRHVLDLHGEDRATYAPSDALCTSLQVLNHLQDCAKDLAALDRCYLPRRARSRRCAALRGLGTELRRVFDGLLDQVDALNRAAVDLPRLTRSRRLRLETAVIVGLAHRLARRLRRGDPLARRVRLTKGDARQAWWLRCGGWCDAGLLPPTPSRKGRGSNTIRMVLPLPLREGVGGRGPA